MSNIPLILTATGIILSLFDIRVGTLFWASSPIIVYITVSFIHRKNLRWWSLLGVLSAFMAVLSYLLKVKA